MRQLTLATARTETEADQAGAFSGLKGDMKGGAIGQPNSDALPEPEPRRDEGPREAICCCVVASPVEHALAAIGNSAVAVGNSAVAIGNSAAAIGNSAAAIGNSAAAIGNIVGRLVPTGSGKLAHAGGKRCREFHGVPGPLKSGIRT